MTHRHFLAVLLSILVVGARALGQPSFDVPKNHPMIVHPGCAVPRTVSGARTFYIDPINGSMSGDGSRARPWRTLAEVVDAGLFATMPTHFDNVRKRAVKQNPEAPIRPGDTVYLLSGDHGVVTIQGHFGHGLIGYDNGDFITIAAAAGQTPQIEQLSILGGSKWIFRGITFRSTNKTGKYMTAYNGVYRDFWLVSLSGPHDDLVIANSYFETQPNVRDWSIEDWRTKRASGVADSGGHCIAIVDNIFHNIGFGIGTQSSKDVLLARNVIDHFSDDGIDYGSSDLIMEENRITNSIEDGDGFHRDGMQGQPFDGHTTVDNVVIRNNTIIRIADPNLPYPAALQGIDEFDGVWQNVEVRNNAVITDATHGISFYGVHHATITKNIVLGDGGKVLPCYVLRGPTTGSDCASKSVVYDPSMTPTIHVGPSKDHVASTDVTVTDNVVNTLGVDPATDPAEVNGNVCVLKNKKCSIGIPVDGKVLWAGKPGSYAGNLIAEFDASEIFVAFDTVNMKYDLTLKTDSAELSPGPDRTPPGPSIVH